MPWRGPLEFGVMNKDEDRSRAETPPRASTLDSSTFVLFICMGAGVGVAFGAAFDNIPVGLALGNGLGVLLGVAFANAKGSKQDNRK